MEDQQRATVAKIRENDAFVRQFRGSEWPDGATYAELDRHDLLTHYDRVIQIVSDWCIEANNVGGVDAGDLAWRLEDAGYPLPPEDGA